MNVTNDPPPVPDVPKYLGQADCEPPESEQEICSDRPGYMDFGEPIVVSNHYLLTQTWYLEQALYSSYATNVIDVIEGIEAGT